MFYFYEGINKNQLPHITTLIVLKMFDLDFDLLFFYDGCVKNVNLGFESIRCTRRNVSTQTVIGRNG